MKLERWPDYRDQKTVSGFLPATVETPKVHWRLLTQNKREKIIIYNLTKFHKEGKEGI